MPRLRRFGRFLLKVLGVLIAVYAFDVVLTRYLLPDALLARIDLERLGTRADDPRPLGLEFLRQQLVNPRNSWTFDEAVYQEWGRKGLEIASANMDRLRAVLAQQGIALTLAVYPWPAQIFEGDLEGWQVRFWQDWAAARAVPFLDLFPAFIGETPPLEAYARYFIPCDSHFNAAGHALVAEGYLAFRQLHP